MCICTNRSENSPVYILNVPKRVAFWVNLPKRVSPKLTTKIIYIINF